MIGIMIGGKGMATNRGSIHGILGATMMMGVETGIGLNGTMSHKLPGKAPNLLALLGLGRHRAPRAHS